MFCCMIFNFTDYGQEITPLSSDIDCAHMSLLPVFWITVNRCVIGLRLVLAGVLEGG